MRISSRAVFRLALTGWLGLAVVSLSAAPSSAAVPSEKSLPSSTFAFIKVNNASELRQAFGQSQMGQLLADPAMKPLKDDVQAKLADVNTKLKDKVGVTLNELLDLPQGPAWLALVGRDDPKVPFAALLVLDAGKNEKALDDVLTKATKQGEAAGGKVSEEKFNDLTFHVIRSGKEEDKDAPPILWTHQGSSFYIATDADALKDVISQATGRDESLATNESFTAIQKKVGGEKIQASWFLDIAQVLKLVTQAGGQGGNAQQAQQIEAMLQLTGFNGLKGIGGSLAFNVGDFDQVSKTFILAPAPAQGVLKIFQMPKANLRPEPWVPASVASYLSVSWDLDNAYTAINDLANMFAPGTLEQLEKKLVGPNGGEPLSFQKDIFGPLGDRVTVVSDFKKPITEQSQRTLIAVALEDAKAFQNTLTKLIAIGQGNPTKREFQGTTIYDFPLPNMPNAPGVAAAKVKPTLSVTVSKDHLLLSTEPTLLEQVLRSGGPSLADNPGFQAVVREIPEQVSVMSYDRAEEQARLLYDMIKNGQLQKAIQGANAAAGPAGAGAAKAGDLIDPDKLPDFSVFAKYLSQGGGYGVMEEDGMTLTRFILRKTNP